MRAGWTSVRDIRMRKDDQGAVKLRRIAICDDEVGTCSDLEKMIMDFADRRGLPIETEVFYSGEAFYRAMQEASLYDLCFLDIKLLGLDGVQVGRQIREQLKNDKLNIVYISSEEAYAMSLFQVRPLDFLIKPLTGEKVSAALEQFIRLSEAGKNEFYFRAGKSVCRLYLDEIRYFACNGRKVEVYAGSGKKEFYGAMRDVWRQVEGKGFFIIHKSYIVNTAFVSVYRYDSVRMTDGACLPISQKYRKEIKERLKERYREG